MALVLFTDRWIQSPSIAPKKGRAEFVDKRCPGLHLRVTAKGSRQFSAVYRAHGRQNRKAIGRYPQITLSAARLLAAELIDSAQAAILTIPTDRSEKFTYENLVDAYSKRYLEPNKIRSRANIIAGLKTQQMEPLLSKPVDEITRRDILKYLDDIMEAGHPQAAVNRLRQLKMLFNWAESRDMISANPCHGLKPPAKGNHRERFLNEDEIRAIWKATGKLCADKRPEDPPIGQMFRMFLLTGQRRDEVATMQWSEIKDGVWTIPREKVKQGRAHTVPLTPTALAVLATLKRGSKGDYVFSTTDGRRPSSNYSRCKAKVQKLSGTSGWNIHDCRRTVRTNLAVLGIPNEVADRVTNHSSSTIHKIYNRHDYLSEKREALQKWDARLLEVTAR